MRLRHVSGHKTRHEFVAKTSRFRGIFELARTGKARQAKGSPSDHAIDTVEGCYAGPHGPIIHPLHSLVKLRVFWFMPSKLLNTRNAEVWRQSEQLRELSWRLSHAQDVERRHIARELHDSASQTLAPLSHEPFNASQ